METNKNVFELNDDELDNVTGGAGEGTPTQGGFSVWVQDKCHFSPSKFGRASGNNPVCGNCIYNPHRSWADSSCDYPNYHYN